MDSLIKVGERLTAARAACQLSKAEVGKALGVHASTLMRWEQGDRRPKQADLQALASIYQVEADWLLEGPSEPAPERTLQRKEQAKLAIQRMLATLPNPSTLEGRNWHSIQAGLIEKRIRRTQALKATEEANLLSEITNRIRPIMLAQHRLPSIPGVHTAVILAIRDGLVVPSPDLISVLARHLHVYPDWLLRGETSKDQPGAIDDPAQQGLQVADSEGEHPSDDPAGKVSEAPTQS